MLPVYFEKTMPSNFCQSYSWGMSDPCKVAKTIVFLSLFKEDETKAREINTTATVTSCHLFFQNLSKQQWPPVLRMARQVWSGHQLYLIRSFLQPRIIVRGTWFAPCQSMISITKSKQKSEIKLLVVKPEMACRARLNKKLNTSFQSNEKGGKISRFIWVHKRRRLWPPCILTVFCFLLFNTDFFVPTLPC